MQEKQRIEELVGQNIYDAKVTTRLNEVEKMNGRMETIGEVEVEFIYRGENSSSVESKKIVLPFDYTIENARIEAGSKIKSNITVLNDQFVIETDDQIAIKIELEFSVDISNVTELNLLETIEETEEELEKHGMVIYFVKPKDTLWEIAKRFAQRWRKSSELIKLNRKRI